MDADKHGCHGMAENSGLFTAMTIERCAGYHRRGTEATELERGIFWPPAEVKPGSHFNILPPVFLQNPDLSALRVPAVIFLRSLPGGLGALAVKIKVILLFIFYTYNTIIIHLFDII
jgi:hypothetical protein